MGMKTFVKKIYIVDDHPVVISGIEAILNQENDLRVCGFNDDVNRALVEINDMQPDLVIVDISLNNINGLDLVKALKKRYTDIKTLVLSMHSEVLYAERAIKSGACGYLMKNELSNTIIEAVQEVLGGGIYLSKKMSARLLKKYISIGSIDAGDPLDKLTDREFEVFRYLSEGYVPREIAIMMNLNIKTIETHRERIKQKFGITSASELNRFAILWREEVQEIHQKKLPDKIGKMLTINKLD